MRILLTAINAKYIHSNLAVYNLKAVTAKYGDQIEVVFCNNDDMALGGIAAMKGAGRFNSDVLVTGIDANDEAVKAVASGEMTQTIKQDADASAVVIVDLLQKMLQGGQVTDDEKVPFIEITKANVAQFVK